MITETDRIIAAIESLGGRITPRPEAQATRVGSSPESTIADVQEWGYGFEPAGPGLIRLVPLSCDAAPLPRWLRRHLREHRDAICRIVSESAIPSANSRLYRDQSAR